LPVAAVAAHAKTPHEAAATAPMRRSVLKATSKLSTCRRKSPPPSEVEGGATRDGLRGASRGSRRPLRQGRALRTRARRSGSRLRTPRAPRGPQSLQGPGSTACWAVSLSEVDDSPRGQQSYSSRARLVRQQSESTDLTRGGGR
jgi:hypothetical protein